MIELVFCGDCMHLIETTRFIPLKEWEDFSSSKARYHQREGVVQPTEEVLSEIPSKKEEMFFRMAQKASERFKKP